VTFLLFAEKEEEWDGLKLILPDGPELLWTAIFFFGLWALMKFVLLPPIIEGRDQRLARVSAGQDSVSDSESELAQITGVRRQSLPSKTRSPSCAAMPKVRSTRLALPPLLEPTVQFHNWLLVPQARCWVAMLTWHRISRSSTHSSMEVDHDCHDFDLRC